MVRNKIRDPMSFLDRKIVTPCLSVFFFTSTTTILGVSLCFRISLVVPTSLLFNNPKVK